MNEMIQDRSEWVPMITTHVQVRLAERGITKSQVYTAIKHGTIVRVDERHPGNSKKQRLVYQYGNLFVVTKGTRAIITAYRKFPPIRQSVQKLMRQL